MHSNTTRHFVGTLLVFLALLAVGLLASNAPAWFSNTAWDTRVIPPVTIDTCSQTNPYNVNGYESYGCTRYVDHNYDYYHYGTVYSAYGTYVPSMSY